MFAKIKLYWHQFKIWIASDLINKLKQRNAILIKGNAELFDRARALKHENERLIAKNVFENEANMETKVRVWAKKCSPMDEPNYAMSARIVVLLQRTLEDRHLTKRQKPTLVSNKQEEAPKSVGLEKGFRRR